MAIISSRNNTNTPETIIQMEAINKNPLHHSGTYFSDRLQTTELLQKLFKKKEIYFERLKEEKGGKKFLNRNKYD